MDQFRFRRWLFDSLNFSFLMMVLYFMVSSPNEEIILENMKFYFILSIAFLVVGVILSEVFLKKGIDTLGEVIFAPPNRRNKNASEFLLGSFWGWQLFITLGLTLWIGGVVTKASLWDVLDEKGISGALKLFEALFAPNWKILPQAIINVIVTIFMAFIATALAIPFAFILSFLCAKNIMKHPIAKLIYFTLRTLFNFMRSIEALIWAIIFSVWVGIGPFAGMLALMIHSIASLAKQYSEMVESVSEGPIEGVLSTGAGFFQTIWFAIVPQVILPYISFTVYRWDTNVRMATIIGFVGGGGIGTMLLKYQGQAMWNEVGTIVIVIAVVVWVMDQASALIREALK